jgi:hypothetical protein
MLSNNEQISLIELCISKSIGKFNETRQALTDLKAGKIGTRMKLVEVKCMCSITADIWNSHIGHGSFTKLSW